MMKRVFPLFFLFFMLLPSLSLGKVCDKIAAIVNGEVITLSDIDQAMSQYGQANILDEGNPLDKEIRLNEARKAVLEQLIEEKLLQKAAQQLNITVEDEDVTKAVEKMKQDGNFSDARFKKELVARGFSPEGYHQFIKEQILRSRIIDAIIKPKVPMADDKLRAYYQSHADDYLAPQVRLSQILIRVPEEPTPKDWEAAKAKMKVVLERLNKGEKFEKLVALYSDDKATAPAGGDLGFFKKGEMIQPLDAVVSTMEVGQVSGVIQSSQGLHLFKVTDKKPGSLPPLEDIKQRVTEDYYREEVIKYYTKFIDDLKARSNVEIKL
jgi:peptidyl-prolyl cis-trans isomerase SurA